MAMRGRGRGDVVRGFDGKASVMTQNRRVKEVETGRLHAKTFGAWANSYLRQRGLRINDLTTDLSDGVLLIQLIELVSGTACPEKYHAKPTLEIQKVENVLIATRFINQYANINVNPKDVVSGNTKVILAIMWRMILHFGVEQRRPDEPPPTTPPKPQTAAARNREIKQRLLDWVNEKIAAYGLHVTDFEQSFQDGLAFAALVHKFDESSFDFARLDPRNPTANLQLAFNLAEQNLGIQPMLDPLDMCNPNPEARPDEQCIITYLSQFPKAFLAATHTLPPIPTRAPQPQPVVPAEPPAPTPAPAPAPVIDFPSLPARAMPSVPPSIAATAQPAGYDGASRYALPDQHQQQQQFASSSALYGDDSSVGGYASPASLASPDLGALPVPSRPLPKPTKALPAFPGADAYASKPLPDPTTAGFGSSSSAGGAGAPTYIDPNAAAAAFGQIAFGDEYSSLYGSMQDGDYHQAGMASGSAHHHGDYGQMAGAGSAQYGDASYAGYGSPAGYGTAQGSFVGGGQPGAGAVPSPSSAAYEDDLARREEEWRRKEEEWRRKEAEMQQMMEHLNHQQQALAVAAANPASSEEARRIAAENLRLQQQLIIIRQNKIGQLTVIVREARNLPAINLTGKSDPYVVVIYKEQKEKTKTVMGTLNPRWNQEYTFYVQGPLATLFLTIYNQNMATADKFIGKIELPLTGLIDGQPLERWFQLQPKKPGKRVTGEIKLYLLYRLNTL